MNDEDFKKQITRHEGLRLFPYNDSVGKLTIGVGRNLEDRGISEDEAMRLLENDIAVHKKELEHHFPIVLSLSPVRYYVLLNMCFNIGSTRLSGFRKMWEAINISNFVKASEEMLDSKWADQVGNRATELSEMMATGEYNP
jgi:lysozyme